MVLWEMLQHGGQDQGPALALHLKHLSHSIPLRQGQLDSSNLEDCPNHLGSLKQQISRSFRDAELVILESESFKAHSGRLRKSLLGNPMLLTSVQ